MTLKNPRKKIILETFTSPQNPLEFLVNVSISLMVGLISINNPYGWLGLIAILLLWCLHWLQKEQEKKRINAAFNQLAYTATPQPVDPCPGLILLISTYSPRKKELTEEMLDPLKDKIIKKESSDLTQDDFDNINLLNSNLAPQIAAIDFHRQNNILKHLWLINTKTNENKTGSTEAVTILQKYLEFKYLGQIKIHSEGLTVSDNNYFELYNTVDRIFQDKSKHYFADEFIIADITGGTKMMSIALTLACIPPKRKLQYMDYSRDWEGNPLPKGESQPILVDIDPILYRPTE